MHFARRAAQQDPADADSPPDPFDGCPLEEMGEPRSGHGAVLRVLQLLSATFDDQDDASAEGRTDHRDLEPGKTACGSREGVIRTGRETAPISLKESSWQERSPYLLPAKSNRRSSGRRRPWKHRQSIAATTLTSS